MSAFAAVMTGKGTGAIATVQLVGDSAEVIIKKIFKPAKTKPVSFKTGKILLGTISNGSEAIDQVTIGCEGRGNFAIHCHGNPLIVADIMQLLQKHGAELLNTEQLLAKILSAKKPANTIALEAKLTQSQAKTLEGTKIIANQIEAGLTEKVEKWLKNTISLEKIKADAEPILKDTKPAKLLIFGCTIVLSGPPNTGKSTLLNLLTGRKKAVIADLEGTTRDWVSGRCRIGPLFAELIDTAGLAEAADGEIEKAAQQKAVELLEKADLVLLILDNSSSANQLGEKFIAKTTGKKVLTVVNKCDLEPKVEDSKTLENLQNIIKTSAKFNKGINNLTKTILQMCDVTDFDFKTAVCFTDRQEKLLKKLKEAESKDEAVQIVTELLNGQL